MINTVWIITSEHNDYDQHGCYFEMAFKNKPTKNQIYDFLKNRFGGFQEYQCDKYKEMIVQHLLDGGGRREVEGVWYYLTEESLS